jgi:hypothetical protein
MTKIIEYHQLTNIVLKSIIVILICVLAIPSGATQVIRDAGKVIFIKPPNSRLIEKELKGIELIFKKAAPLIPEHYFMSIYLHHPENRINKCWLKAYKNIVEQTQKLFIKSQVNSRSGTQISERNLKNKHYVVIYYGIN